MEAVLERTSARHTGLAVGVRSDAEGAYWHRGRLPERIDVDRATDAAVSALGREAFTGVLERGRRMNIEEAAGYALSGDTVG